MNKEALYAFGFFNEIILITANSPQLKKENKNHGNTSRSKRIARN